MFFFVRNLFKKHRLQIEVYLLLLLALVLTATCRPAAAQIGQTVIEDTQALIKVMEVRDEMSVERISPETGYKFIGIDVLVDNTKGLTGLNVFSHDFVLKDREGYWYETFGPITEMALPNGDLESGDLVRGWIVFEIPASTELHSMRLRYGGFQKKSAWILLSEHPSPPEERPRDDTASLAIAQTKIAATDTIVRITAIKDKVKPDRDFPRAGDGKKFVGIEVLVDNTQGATLVESVRNTNFTLKDTRGYYYTSPGMPVRRKQLLPACTVEPGDLVKGWVFYELPSFLKLRTMWIRYDGAIASPWLQLSDHPKDVDGDSAKETLLRVLNEEGIPLSAQAFIQGTNTAIRLTKFRDHLSSERESVLPEEGKRFVGMNVLIDNTTGTDTIRISPRNFTLKDREGFQYASDSGAVITPALFSNVVEIGDFMRGWIYFQIPISVDISTAKLRYGELLKKSDWLELSETLQEPAQFSQATPEPEDAKEPEVPKEPTPSAVTPTPSGNVTPDASPPPLDKATPTAELTAPPRQGQGGEIPQRQLFLRFLGLLLLMMVVPVGLHHLFTVPHARVKDGLLGGVAVLTYSVRYFAAEIAENLTVQRTSGYIADLLFLSILLYSLLTGLHYERRVSWSKKKRVIINLMIFVGILLSALLYDTFYDNVMPFFPVIYSGLGILICYSLMTSMFGASSFSSAEKENEKKKDDDDDDGVPPDGDILIGSAANIEADEEFYQQYNISPREQEVLQLLLQGKSNNEIGETLYVSRNTIKTHIRNIYAKLGVNNRYELIYMLKHTHQSPSSEHK